MNHSADCLLLIVRVTPQSSKNALEGWILHKGEEVLKMRVTAPPAKGKANEAVLHLLADTLGIPKSRLTLINGPTCRRKVIKIEGNPLDLEKKLPPNNLGQKLF